MSQIGIFVTEYDGHKPVSFSASSGSYAAKLIEAYKILGGFPERDMLLRTMDQPVFLTRGPGMSVDSNANLTGGFSDVYSNGRRYRGDQRFDRDVGLRVEKLKKWQLGSIKLKKERLEYKIKRALYFSDQLANEIKQIDEAMSDGLGGFEDQVLDIDLHANKEGTYNLVQDLDDVFGLFIGRPTDYSFDDAIVHGAENRERGQV